MNILILSWRGPGHPHEGGAELVTQEYARAWIKAGHHVTLFTSMYVGGQKNEKIDGVNVIRKGGYAFGVKIHAFLWYITQAKNFDLIVDHFHGIPFFTPLYVRVHKIGFIHETAQEVWSLNTWRFPLNLIPTVIGRIGEPFVFLLYKGIPFITVSKSTKNNLINFGLRKNNITVINNGVRILKSTESKNKNLTIMFLGAIAKDKGVEDAIECFKKVFSLNKNSELYIVGKGSPTYLTLLKDKIIKLGLSKKITLFGFVSDQKKFDLLKRSHIFVNPSVHEGWGLVNIEANSQGLPVIGYDVSGTRDSVVSGKTGILVKTHDIDGFAKAILLLAQDSKLYEKYSTEAILHSREYTWKAAAQRSLIVINKICQKK